MKRVALLSGGLGGARLAPPLARALGPDRLTIVANVGDDLDWRGLRVSPDVDSILYALAGVWDAERGWGRRGETFAARDALAALGEQGWFGVGDRDLALHLFRADRLRAGETPTAVIADALARFGVSGVRLLPASDEPNRTMSFSSTGGASRSRSGTSAKRRRPRSQRWRSPTARLPPPRSTPSLLPTS